MILIQIAAQCFYLVIIVGHVSASVLCHLQSDHKLVRLEYWLNRLFTFTIKINVKLLLKC